MEVEDFVKSVKIPLRRAKRYYFLQMLLVSLCFIFLFSAAALLYLDGRPEAIRFFGYSASFCGFASMLAGNRRRKMALLSVRNAETFDKLLKHAESKRKPQIPLTIGFANLSGKDLATIAFEDLMELSPLFTNFKAVPFHQIPNTEILFLYAHLNADGTLKGLANSGVLQLVQLTGAKILILASPNSPESIAKASALPGPKTANVVFTLDRNGSGLAKFYVELFKKMRDGKDMLTAWYEIAPQNPNLNIEWQPHTVLMAAGGKIVFPPPTTPKQ